MKSEHCAERLFEVIPPLMQLLRQEIRVAVRGRLSVLQFRALARLAKGPLGVSELADWIGVSLPAMSRMIEALARRGLVLRTRPTTDRRQVLLALTKEGTGFYNEVKTRAKKSMALKIKGLTLKQRES